MRYIRFILVFGLLLTAAVSNVSAQDSERSFVRMGNRAYRSQKWADAETEYRKALSKDSRYPVALYNLGCALLQQNKDSLAMEQFANAAKLEPGKMRRAKAHHNMGVICQRHQQYAQAIACYMEALRCNPADDQTRYNLALCKKLLKNQPQQNKDDKNKDQNKQQDKNKDSQDKNKDKKDQDKDKQQNKKDQDKNKDSQDKNKQQNKKQNQDKGQQNPNQEKMSRENAEQLLNAAVQQEKNTKSKLQKAMSQPRRKQYEKYW